MSLGQRIKSLRIARGLSQTRLAKAVGVTQGALSQIELGTVHSVKAETLVRLAGKLAANPQWIQTGQGSPIANELNSVEESEVLAVYRALTTPHRGAWLATGRALLEAQGVTSPAQPFRSPTSRVKTRA